MLARTCLVTIAALTWMLCAVSPADSWKRAQPGWTYQFPRDERSHPDFKTEWWYFTGNLRDAQSGRRFGYQLTFFRHGVRPPAERTPVKSRFVADHIWFAHFAVSDLKKRQFHVTEKVSRGAFSQAGSDDGGRIVWIDGWELRQAESGAYQLAAVSEDFAFSLDLRPTKPPVFHGEAGISAKSADPSNASHYYAHTALATTGNCRIGEQEFEVRGKSWYDREWSTSLLSRDQVGWDWFALQFDDGAELMLFQLRNPDGGADFSSGTYVRADGSALGLKNGDFTLTPKRTWTSKSSGGTYPVEWDASIPALNAKLRIRAAFDAQELRLSAANYWEGAIIVGGERTGRGYLEMTGYAGKIRGLSE